MLAATLGLHRASMGLQKVLNIPATTLSTEVDPVWWSPPTFAGGFPHGQNPPALLA